MSLPYARNAEAIAEARSNGMRPSGPVLVALCRIPDWPNAVVYARPNVAYRWDWVRGLPIVVLVEAATKMADILRSIADKDPQQIDVVDIERRIGWLVGFIGSRMVTCRWPAECVDDWLEDGAWHRELHAAKVATWN